MHVAAGVFAHGLRRTALLAIGVTVGAQVGARLSTRVRGVWILRALATALGFVGVRVLLQALVPSAWSGRAARRSDSNAGEGGWGTFGPRRRLTARGRGRKVVFRNAVAVL